MIQSVAEYNVESIIFRVQNVNDPLIQVLYHSLICDQKSENLSQILTILSYILERYQVVFQIEAWRIFCRLIVGPILSININSTKDDPCYRISRDCLFYLIYGDKVVDTYKFCRLKFFYFRIFLDILFKKLCLNNRMIYAVFFKNLLMSYIILRVMIMNYIKFAVSG